MKGCVSDATLSDREKRERERERDRERERERQTERETERETDRERRRRIVLIYIAQGSIQWEGHKRQSAR